MDGTRPYVLVVDDEPDAADSMVDLLDLWGYDAAARYCGASALAAVLVRRPAAVLLDIGMAPMDGFAFTARLRMQTGCERTAVVAMSGHTAEAHQARSRELGIDHYLFKPADPEEVRARLARIIRCCHRQRPVAEHKSMFCRGLCCGIGAEQQQQSVSTGTCSQRTRCVFNPAIFAAEKQHRPDRSLALPGPGGGEGFRPVRIGRTGTGRAVGSVG